MEKMPRRRKCQPTLVFLPGKSHGQRSLVSYNPWGCKRVEHNLATKQQNVIFPIFEKNFSYSPFSATDSLLCLPLLGKLLEGAVQTHTSLFPFLYTILVTHASQSLHWNFSFMVTTVSIFLNLGSALTLICSVRNFFGSHFFFVFFLLEILFSCLLGQDLPDPFSYGHSFSGSCAGSFCSSQSLVNGIP